MMMYTIAKQINDDDDGDSDARWKHIFLPRILYTLLNPFYSLLYSTVIVHAVFS